MTSALRRFETERRADAILRVFEMVDARRRGIGEGLNRLDVKAGDFLRGARSCGFINSFDATGRTILKCQPKTFHLRLRNFLQSVFFPCLTIFPAGLVAGRFVDPLK
jgi:hypothetical protein